VDGVGPDVSNLKDPVLPEIALDRKVPLLSVRGDEVARHRKRK
jgi:hypothetical protein